MDMRLKSPFTAILVGPTGSGKTVEMEHLIANREFNCTKPPVQVIYCYGAWQPRFDMMKDVTFVEGIVDVEDIPNDGKQRWVIIDDLMEEVGGSAKLNNLFTKHSHHRNLSVFYIAQSLFRKEHRIVSVNAQYMFMFKNPRDSLTVDNLSKQAFSDKVREVRGVYKKATKQKHTFLLIDLRQETDDSARLIGNFCGKNGFMRAYDVSE